MANTSRINGFRPVKHTNGSPYNGQSNMYYVASAADEILVGDIAKLGGSADTNGIPSADLCGDRKSTRLNSSHVSESRMPSSA